MKIPRIKMLGLSLTGQCNFACRYCYAAEHAGGRMSVETALRAVKMAAAAGTGFVIQFTGGEPLLNFSCLQAVVNYVEEQHLPALMQIQTNASLLDDEKAVFLQRHRVGIGISLDGKPGMNDKLRLTRTGEGATKYILRGIEVLKDHHIPCGLTCVVTAENVNNLAEIVDMAYFLGNVRKLGFDLLRGQGRGAGLAAPTESEMTHAMEAVYQRNRELGGILGYKLLITQQQRVQSLSRGCSDVFGHCHAMNGEAAFVDALGDIYACSSLVGNPEFYLGNVQSGLDQQLVHRIREKIAQSMSFCRQCKDFNFCGGGCYARWLDSGFSSEYKTECAMQRVSILNELKNK